MTTIWRLLGNETERKKEHRDRGTQGTFHGQLGLFKEGKQLPNFIVQFHHQFIITTTHLGTISHFFNTQ